MLLNVAVAAFPTALFTAAVAFFSAQVTFSQLQLLSSFLALPPFPFSYAVSKVSPFFLCLHLLFLFLTLLKNSCMCIISQHSNPRNTNHLLFALRLCIR